MLAQFAHTLILARVRLFRLVYFEVAFFAFSVLPRAPAPLCYHGLLRQRVNNVRTTTNNDNLILKSDMFINICTSNIINQHVSRAQSLTPEAFKC